MKSRTKTNHRGLRSTRGRKAFRFLLLHFLLLSTVRDAAYAIDLRSTDEPAAQESTLSPQIEAALSPTFIQDTTESDTLADIIEEIPTAQADEPVSATGISRATILSRCQIGKPPAPLTNGVLYQFGFQNADEKFENIQICCPEGQLPTGKTKVSDARCTKPHAKSRRGCTAVHAKDPSNTVAVCLSSDAPFSVCCPSGQVATCDADASRQQCESATDVAINAIIGEEEVSTLEVNASLSETEEAAVEMVDKVLETIPNSSFEFSPPLSSEPSGESSLDPDRFIFTELELFSSVPTSAVDAEGIASEDPGPDGFVSLGFPSPVPNLSLCMRLATMSSSMTRPGAMGSETLYYIAAAGACCATTTTAAYSANVAAICGILYKYDPKKPSATALRWKTCVEYAKALEPLCSLSAPLMGRIWKVVNGITPPKIIGPGKVIPGIPPIF